MSTIEAKQNALRARREPAVAFGPLELLAAGVAQAHGLFVMSAALSGLAGFPRRSLPWLAAGWAASAGLALSAAIGAYMHTWTAPWRTTSP
ncbi:MAG: hypothetical protein J2P51_07305 [Hyphomicrobiaceae bacterium]|nr:hypothetical protein [Hyphomicrobiaceae bacterium]